ncbi:MAG: alpha/beta fold hydrolase, partial [Anaerolineae bacterium]|nr:alpha/beta fold hydrolase [Anaerolineae bacterium]
MVEDADSDDAGRLEVISRAPETGPDPAHPTPLLFVHGMWGGAWVWDDYFLPYFAQHGYTVHALSLRGHGASAGREKLRWARIRDYVADVAQVAGTLPAPPVVIGHSMGGLVVQKYLERHAAPAGVLVASAPVHGLILSVLRVARAMPLALLKANLTLDYAHLVNTPNRLRFVLFSADLAADRLAAYQPRLSGASYLVTLEMLGPALPRPKRVKAPVLVLGAEADTLFSEWEIRRTARKYHTEAVIVPGMA